MYVLHAESRFLYSWLSPCELMPRTSSTISTVLCRHSAHFGELLQFEPGHGMSGEQNLRSIMQKKKMHVLKKFTKNISTEFCLFTVFVLFIYVLFCLCRVFFSFRVQ
jgi:hypothetical protein